MLPKIKSSTENGIYVIDNQSIDLDEKLTDLNPLYLVVWVKLKVKFTNRRTATGNFLLVCSFLSLCPTIIIKKKKKKVSNKI